MEQDQELHFIPPCCVSSKLPKATDQSRGTLRFPDAIEGARGVLSFYTHSDVSMEQFYRSISYKVRPGHVLVLRMTTATEPTLRFLAFCLDRKWISDLVLTTGTDNTYFVNKHLGDDNPHVLYCHHDSVSALNSHMVLYSDANALTISGPMYNLASIDKEFAEYTLIQHHSFLNFTRKECGNPLLNIILPDILRHRQQMAHSTRKISPNLLAFLQCTIP